MRGGRGGWLGFRFGLALEEEEGEGEGEEEGEGGCVDGERGHYVSDGPELEKELTVKKQLH